MYKEKIKKFSALFLCLILLYLSVYSGYSVSDIDEVIFSDIPENGTDIPDLDNYGLEVEEDGDNKLVFSSENDFVSLSDKYDPRNSNILTSVKDQNPFGLCWMYATNAMLETFVSKKYGSPFDVSELHGAVFRSKIINKYNTDYGYYVNSYDTGGDITHAIQYLTNWNEPVYSNYKWHSIIDDSLYSKENFQIIDNTNHNYTTLMDEQVIIDDGFEKSNPLFCLTDAKYIPNEEVSIKNAIKEYGAVYIRINYQKRYTQIDDNCDYALYNNKLSNKPNHAVCIVGWDDNYSKSNFKKGIQPQNDGAWLAKNSYGTSTDNSGYVWISYEDTSLSYYKTSFVINGIQKADDSEYMLSHDILTLNHKKTEPYGKIDLVSKEKVIFANVFDIKNYVNIYSEINKVMFYLAVKDCSYNIKIKQIENDMPDDITDLAILASGTYNGEGYLTETLSTPFVFTSDSNCVVFIEVIPNSSNSEIYFPVENYINVDRNEGESYCCIDPIDDALCWVDEIESASNYTGNYCIRPILKKKSCNHFAEINSELILDTTKDGEVEYNSDSYLFNIHTSNNVILRENRDYIKTDNKVIFKSSYLQSLKDTYTEIMLEFNNDIIKTVVVNPKAKITGVNINGKYAVGETLTAVLATDVIKDNYDINYQWQSSIDGFNWYDISNANQKEYIVNNNDFLRYIRVIVKSSSKYGNVEYPSKAVSTASKTKCVIMGDTDLDCCVNIDDATGIQKYLVSLVEFSSEQVVSADFNSDGAISINDVTAIQKMLVQ